MCPVSPSCIAPIVEAEQGTTESLPDDLAIQLEDAVLDDPIYGPDESKAPSHPKSNHHRSKVLPSPKEMTEE